MDVSNCGELRFESLHEVIDVEHMRCIGQSTRGFEQRIRDLTKNARQCLERGKAWNEGCSNKATRKQQAEGCSTSCSFKHE